MDRYYEVGIRYEKTMENGMQKKVTEQHLVNALTFSEAEARIIEEMSAFISGEFDVVTMKITKYLEIIGKDCDRYYKVKINTIALDERTGQEKKTPTYYLVNANSIEDARKAVIDFLGSSMLDFEIEALQETKIMDVFEYKA